MFNRKNVSRCAGLLVVFFAAGTLSAQTITTASAYFKTISEFYGSIKTYEADMLMNVGKQDMAGHVSFKRPDLLRIDFSNPQNQVIVYNGDSLTIYLPESSAVLTQQVENGGGSGTTLATPQGLALMSRYYTVAYKTGPDAEPLDEMSDEKVIKLMLYRRTASESFRSIELAINPTTKLIRRVTALTTRGELFVMNFTNYSLNQDISDQRFIYDPPSSANNYNNFLFSE